MRETKLIDIVKSLSMKGHKIRYFRRKDGSIRITRIDGVSYIGSQGNIAARSLAGITLSEARKVQLESIKTEKGHFGHKRASDIPEEIMKKIRRVQRKWRKNKVQREGYVGKRGARYTYEHYGYEEAMRQLNEQERYAEGLAYTENVKWIIDYIKDTIYTKAPEKDKAILDEFLDIMERNKPNLKEADIAPIHDMLYDYRDGKISVQTLLSNLKKLYK